MWEGLFYFSVWMFFVGLAGLGIAKAFENSETKKEENAKTKESR